MLGSQSCLPLQQQLDRVGGKCLELFPGLWALLPVRTWLWILGFVFVFQLISGAAVLRSFSSNYISPVGFSIEFPRLFGVSTFQINTGSPGPLHRPLQPSLPLFPCFLPAKSKLSRRARRRFRNPRSRPLELFSRHEAHRDSKTHFWHQCTYCGHFSETWLSHWRLELPSIK